MSYWAVARLHPNREKIALIVLNQRGFQIYRPCVQERRVIQGPKTTVSVGLFPGYVFVSIELQ